MRRFGVLLALLISGPAYATDGQCAQYLRALGRVAGSTINPALAGRLERVFAERADLLMLKLTVELLCAPQRSLEDALATALDTVEADLSK